MTRAMKPSCCATLPRFLRMSSLLVVAYLVHKFADIAGFGKDIGGVPQLRDFGDDHGAAAGRCIRRGRDRRSGCVSSTVGKNMDRSPASNRIERYRNPVVFQGGGRDPPVHFDRAAPAEDAFEPALWRHGIRQIVDTSGEPRQEISGRLTAPSHTSDWAERSPTSPDPIRRP